MSDDFMSDLDVAISGQESSSDFKEGVIESVSNEVPQQQSQPQSQQQPSVEEELASFFENEKTSGHIPGTEPKKEEPVKVVDTDAIDLKEDKEEEEVKTEVPVLSTKKQARLLDTFLEQDAEGNLTLPDGTIIAPAGKGRAYYEGLKNEARMYRSACDTLAQKNRDLAIEFKKLYETSKSFKKDQPTAIQSIVKETGFTEAEASQAMTLVRQYKENPIAAIKSLLTQASMNGISLEELGTSISISPAELKTSLDSILSQNRQQKDDEEKDTSTTIDEHAYAEAVKNAENEAQEFLNKNPQAEQFTQYIAHAKQQFPNMSLQEIWDEIRKAVGKQMKNKPNSALSKKPQPKKQLKSEPKPKQRNFGHMSFAEIANTIIEDMPS
jgi:hypothetical protein